jgi:Zn-dependent protease with chaperone function
MFIVEPLTGGQSIMNLFASHPPTEKRIAALRQVEANIQGVAPQYMG